MLFLSLVLSKFIPKIPHTGDTNASKKTALDGADRQTDRHTHTHGHGDSMTNLAQWGRVGENVRLMLNLSLAWVLESV